MFGSQVSGILRGRCRELLECHKVPLEKSYAMFVRAVVLPKSCPRTFISGRISLKIPTSMLRFDPWSTLSPSHVGRLLLSQTQRKPYYFTLVTLQKSFTSASEITQDPMRTEKIFSIITGWILTGMTVKLVWDDNLSTMATHNWMWLKEMRHIILGAIGEISTPEKGGWPGLDKRGGRP